VEPLEHRTTGALHRHRGPGYPNKQTATEAVGGFGLKVDPRVIKQVETAFTRQPDADSPERLRQPRSEFGPQQNPDMAMRHELPRLGNPTAPVLHSMRAVQNREAPPGSSIVRGPRNGRRPGGARDFHGGNFVG